MQNQYNRNNQNNQNSNGQTNVPQSQQAPQSVNPSTQGTWSNQTDPYSYDVFKGYEPEKDKKK